MDFLRGFLQKYLGKYYDICVVNIEPKTKSAIGLGMIILSIICFIFSTKNSKKGEMIGRWWLFWISSIFLILGVVYLNL